MGWIIDLSKCKLKEQACFLCCLSLWLQDLWEQGMPCTCSLLGAGVLAHFWAKGMQSKAPKQADCACANARCFNLCQLATFARLPWKPNFRPPHETSGRHTYWPVSMRPPKFALAKFRPDNGPSDGKYPFVPLSLAGLSK